MRVLIGGSGSTGSTLLQNILNRHDEIFCGSELNLFNKENIVYVPWNEMNMLPSYCQISDIGIIPSYVTKQAESGMPNKFFQYLLFGIPIITNNVKIRRDFVNKYNCGFTFKDRNVKDLSEKIMELYKNEKLRKEMGKNGKKAVIEKYNWENTSKNIVHLYSKIVDRDV